MSPGEAAFQRQQSEAMPEIVVQARPIPWWVWIATGVAVGFVLGDVFRTEVSRKKG